MSISNETSIYISDLDGTLLRPDASLSSHSRRSIIRILERGILFTIATARSVTSTKEILGDLPFELPVICSNGGSIYNYKTLEPLHVELIPEHITGELIFDIKKRNDTAFISVNIDGAEKLFYDSIPNDGMQWYHDDRVEARDTRLTFVEDIRELVGQPVIAVTFMNRLFHIDETRKYFSEQYKGQVRLNYFENKYSRGWHWLSLHSALATKANAVDRLKQLLDLNSSKVVAFGDELNDISMFEKADRAIAVGNALPSVIESAHEVIGGNNEDAVVNYILSKWSMA